VAGFLNITIDMLGAVQADGLDAGSAGYWNSAELRDFQRGKRFVGGWSGRWGFHLARQCGCRPPERIV